VFVFFDQISFDSDQALAGLLAKHISEFKSFSLYPYGLDYMLALESFLAAPVFAVFGQGITQLKMPVLVMNIATLIMLMAVLVRECGLKPHEAFLSSLFFAVPNALVSCRLSDAQGGNIEPFMFMILMWILRRRPAALGIIAAIGFMNREFVLYGIFWLVAIQAFNREIEIKSLLKSACYFIIAFLALKALSFIPGDSIITNSAGQNFSGGFIASIPSNIKFLCANLLPAVLGLKEIDPKQYEITSGVILNSGAMRYTALLMYAVIVCVFSGVVFRENKKLVSRKYSFALYLLLIGISSCAGFIVMGEKFRHVMHIRYILLVILIPAGMSVMIFSAGRKRIAGAAAAFAIIAISAVNLYGAGLITAEYFNNPPPDKYGDLADYLVQSNIEYSLSDYWTAYNVTFRTGEKAIVVPTKHSRIKSYYDMYFGNIENSYVISRSVSTGCPVVHEWSICRQAGER